MAVNTSNPAPADDGADYVIDATDAGSLQIPGGDMLLRADFVRQGPDLLLEGQNGETVLVKNFFANQSPPELLTESGARIGGDLAAKLAGPMAPGQIAEVGQLAQAGSAIGQVEKTAGKAFITHADGTKVEAGPGTSVFQGDVIETEAGGSVGIVFADDTTFSLGESGRMILDEMVYDAGEQTGKAAFNVVQGVFAFVSGQIAKTGPEAMTVTTPVAVIGIRGTHVAGKAATEGARSTFTLLPNEDGSTGEISIGNGAGTLIMNKALQTTQISSSFLPPLPPVVIPQAAANIMYAQTAPTPQAGTPGAAADGGAAPGTQQGAAVVAAASNAIEAAIEQGATGDQMMAAAAQAALAELGTDGNTAQLTEAFGGLLSDDAINALSDVISGGGLNTGPQGPLTGAPVGSDGPGGVFGPSGPGGFLDLIGSPEGDILGPEGPINQGGDLLNPDGLIFIGEPPPDGGELIGIIGGKIDDIIKDFIEPPPTAPTVEFSVSGTQTQILTGFQNDVVTGSTGNDTITFSGVAQGGDVFDGVSGTDTLILDATQNVVRVSNTDTLKLGATTGLQAINMATAGAMTITAIAGTAQPAPIAISGIGAVSNVLNQDITFGFTLSGSTVNIAMSDGTDSLTFAQGTNVIDNIIGVETLNFANGSIGASSLSLGSPVSGATVNATGGNLNTLALTLSSGGASSITVNGEMTVTANSSATDAFTLGTGNDILTLGALLTAGETITDTGGTDTVQLLAGSNSASFTGVETIKGTASVDNLTLATNLLTGSTVTLLGASDVLNLSAGTNTTSLTDIESVVGTSSADTLVLQNIQSGTSINLAGGTDVLTLANATNTITVTDIETVNGNAGVDTISVASANSVTVDLAGGAGNDTLSGASGSNVIFSGDGGNDTFTGGGFANFKGFDTLDYSSDAGNGGSGAVTVSLSGGSATDGFGATDSFSSIEQVIGTAGADTITGSDTSGVANPFFNDFEAFAGLGGNDTINGVAGFDRVDYSQDSANSGTGAVTVNLSTGTATDGFGATDTLSNIDSARGTSGADTFTANTLGNQFIGLAGNDTITGGTGKDEVRYDQDASFGGSAGVTVNLATGTATDGFGNTDTLSSIENVRGTSSADTLTGNSSNNRFRGLGGNDTLNGGAGTDDEADYSRDADAGGTAAVTVNLGTGTATDGFGNTDSLTAIESARGTSLGDTFIGGAGENDFAGLDGADTFSGGAGVDLVDYSFDKFYGGTAAVTVNIATGTATDGFGKTDTLLNSIEGAEGTVLGDTFTGDANANVFAGIGGADTMVGGGGNDTFEIEANADLASGEIITGGTGTDTLAIDLGFIGVTALDLTNVAMTGVETINMNNGAAAGVVLTLDAADIADVTTIQGDGTADKIVALQSANVAGKTFTGIETVVLSSGVTITYDSTTTGTGLTAINGIAGGAAEALILSSGNEDLTGVTFTDITTFTANQASANQNITIDGATVLNGMNFVGSGTTLATEDDIIVSTGNVNFSNSTLTDIGVQLANNTGLSQTVSANANSALFGAGIEFFDGTGGTNDIFDYTSALVSGNGTGLAAASAITLTELNAQQGGTTFISGDTTGAIEFNFTQAYLGFDLDVTAAATVLTNIQAILESASSLSSGGAATQGGVNTDMLFVFYEAASQGTDPGAIVVRYQEGASSEASFAGELSIVTDFEIAQGSLADASFN